MIKGNFRYDKETLIKYWNEEVEPLLLRVFKEVEMINTFKRIYNPKHYPNEKHNELIYNSMADFMDKINNRVYDCAHNSYREAIFFYGEDKKFCFPMKLTFHNILYFNMLFTMSLISHFEKYYGYQSFKDDKIFRNIKNQIIKGFLRKRNIVDRLDKIVETIKAKY